MSVAYSAECIAFGPKAAADRGMEFQVSGSKVPPRRITHLQSILDSNELYPRYNWSMAFAIFSMRLLELVFFVGLVGSAVVVVISFVEDGKELFGKD